MLTNTQLFNERLVKLLKGHWLDSMGNSVLVASDYSGSMELTAVVTPLIDHPGIRDRVLEIRCDGGLRSWRCGPASLEWVDEEQQRVVWGSGKGVRSVWSRTLEGISPSGYPTPGSAAAFPWLLHGSEPEVWKPLSMPRDILYDCARICVVLDIRQLIGGRTEPQERLTHILMDHDITANGAGDYLIPGASSPVWRTLQVPEYVRRKIAQRVQRVHVEALSQRVVWKGETEIWVGRHRIGLRERDIKALEARWVPAGDDETRMRLEIARLLALYSVFDNPLSDRRHGVHLGVDPQIRRHSDFELFASPLNAAVPNGCFASKWPHIEWRFGSIGRYPVVLSQIPVKSVVCVNPPFTDAYLSDVMGRLAELKLRFRLRLSIPIQDSSWRKKLLSSLPSSRLLTTYYDASSERYAELCHPTVLWEDPNCPKRRPEVSSSVLCFFDEDEVEAPPSEPLPLMDMALPNRDADVQKVLSRAAQHARESWEQASSQARAAAERAQWCPKQEVAAKALALLPSPPQAPPQEPPDDDSALPSRILQGGTAFWPQEAGATPPCRMPEWPPGETGCDVDMRGHHKDFDLHGQPEYDQHAALWASSRERDARQRQQELDHHRELMFAGQASCQAITTDDSLYGRNLPIPTALFTGHSFQRWEGPLQCRIPPRGLTYPVPG